MTTVNEGRSPSSLAQQADEDGGRVRRAQATAAPAAVPTRRRGSIARNRAGLTFLAGDVVAVAGMLAIWRPTLDMSEIFTLFLLLGLLANGLYRSRFTLSVLDDSPRLVGVTLIAGALTALAAQALGMPAPFGQWPMALIAPVLLILGRTITYHGVRRLRRRHHLAHRALVLGAGMVGQELALQMLEHPKYGLTPVGFVDDSPLVSGPASVAPVLGGQAQLADLIETYAIDELIVAFTAATGESMVEVLRTADRLQCEVSVVPRLFELGGRRPETDEVNGIPLTRLRRASFRSPTWALKRVMDLVVSGLALVVLSPLLGLIALVLRLTDGPGVIFRQERVGLDGQAFELLKFRSLRPADESESGTKWNIKNDDRMGPVGKFIRRTSIDELPQLWNILRGDMSLVGPRPERPYFVEAFGDAFPRYDARHRVPCGLTGWAQIHGLRGDTSIEERARFDNYYIENWSLWLDIKIILRTVGSLMKGSG